MSELAIEYGWLVERVGYHTCGAGESGYYGHHEAGCGSMPVAELKTLPGYDEWVDEARTVTAEEVEAAEAAIVEMLHDADEDGEGLDDLDLAQRAVAVTLNALGLRAGGPDSPRRC